MTDELSLWAQTKTLKEVLEVMGAAIQRRQTELQNNEQMSLLELKHQRFDRDLAYRQQQMSMYLAALANRRLF